MNYKCVPVREELRCHGRYLCTVGGGRNLAISPGVSLWRGGVSKLLKGRNMHSRELLQYIEEGMTWNEWECGWWKSLRWVQRIHVHRAIAGNTTNQRLTWLTSITFANKIRKSRLSYIIRNLLRGSLQSMGKEYSVAGAWVTDWRTVSWRQFDYMHW